MSATPEQIAAANAALDEALAPVIAQALIRESAGPLGDDLSGLIDEPTGPSDAEREALERWALEDTRDFDDALYGLGEDAA